MKTFFCLALLFSFCLHAESFRGIPLCITAWLRIISSSVVDIFINQIPALLTQPFLCRDTLLHRHYPASSLQLSPPTPYLVDGRVSQVPNRTLCTRYPPCPRHVLSFDFNRIPRQLLTSDSLIPWSNGTYVTRLVQSFICIMARTFANTKLQAVSCLSACSCCYSQRLFHETNSFQFVSSAKLFLAHQIAHHLDPTGLAPVVNEIEKVLMLQPGKPAGDNTNRVHTI